MLPLLFTSIYWIGFCDGIGAPDFFQLDCKNISNGSPLPSGHNGMKNSSTFFQFWDKLLRRKINRVFTQPRKSPYNHKRFEHPHCAIIVHIVYFKAN